MKKIVIEIFGKRKIQECIVCREFAYANKGIYINDISFIQKLVMTNFPYAYANKGTTGSIMDMAISGIVCENCKRKRYI